MLFRNKGDLVPWRVLGLDGCESIAEGSLNVKVQARLGTYVFRLPNTATRDEWVAKLATASRPLKQVIEEEIKVRSTAHPAVPSGPAPNECGDRASTARLRRSSACPPAWAPRRTRA